MRQGSEPRQAQQMAVLSTGSLDAWPGKQKMWTPAIPLYSCFFFVFLHVSSEKLRKQSIHNIINRWLSLWVCMKTDPQSADL